MFTIPFKKLFNKKLVASVLCSTLLLGTVSIKLSSNKEVSSFGDTKVVHAETKPNAEFRSAWVSTIWNLDFKQTNGSASAFKSEYTRVLNAFNSMNMNAVTFQVRPANDAFYPSTLNPWSKYLTGTQGKSPEAGFDPLAYMVSETHKKGMEFHAWFNPYRVTESAQTGKTKEQILATLSSNNFARKNPDAVMLYNGKLYLNPGEPKAQQFVIDTVMEVVKKYDIDAVHFDDYFYPYGGFKTTNPDIATYKKYGTGFSSIENWRRNNIDNLIKNLNTQIKSAKSDVKFGISPFGIWGSKSKHPSGSPEGEGSAVSSGSLSSYDDIFADTRKWVKNNWIDYITPQLYWSMNNSISSYKVLVDWWGNVVQGTKCNLYIGHAVYKYRDGEANTNEVADWKNPSEIPNQITYSRNNANVKGSSFFSLRDLESNIVGFKTTLVSSFYTSKVSIPGSVSVTPSYPTEKLRVYSTGVSNRLVWIDSKTSTSKSYNIYRFTGSEAVNTQSTTHLLKTVNRSGSATYLAYNDTTIKLSTKYTYIIEALDSSGNIIKQFKIN
ncbi:glycoside hydrolase family 10 protein [Clostridium cylindrosporum]|uniref:Glycosyl hydrolase-like 10 domain-containing protein n=1 Tax=Clostridium cylindrosporum DSM 605 TaxID=1121307 RepID=A0A0J8D5J3_CLOCY|nr:family 10 glycosylhydrolase [Clostridium cylindrosporum]KMT21097.1 hypothetical protein CLCY_1c03310 [Clostridium cylindrosporum DSM 605]